MRCQNSIKKEIEDGLEEYDDQKPMKLSSVGKRMTKITHCPVCHFGVNSPDNGGTTACFHCDLCGFTECMHTDNEINYLMGKEYECNS